MRFTALIELIEHGFAQDAWTRFCEQSRYDKINISQM